MNAPKKLTPLDPDALLEQRFTYRVQAYLADNRNIDAEFTLPGLRGWMLCQKWPDPPGSATLECLAILCWAAICQVESEPERESDIRSELERQIDYLTGGKSRRPASLDTLLSRRGRANAYASLLQAAAPGSSHRVLFGLPRFNAAEKLP